MNVDFSKLDLSKAKGKFRFIDSVDGKVIKVADWYHNLIVANTGNGFSAILRQMAGESSASLEFTKAQLGAGTTPPTLADTGLEDMDVDNILLADVPELNASSATFQFFAPSIDVPTGTYNEVGFFMGSALWSRAIIDPAYEKSGSADTKIEYVLTFSNI